MNKALAVSLFLLCAAVGVHAQTGTPTTGWITNLSTVNASTYCPSAQGWINGPAVTCVQATVNCPTENGVTVAALDITFAYETPSPLKGTIVFFSGGDGTTPDGQPPDSPSPAGHDIEAYAIDYYAAGYQVIQTAWKEEWEDPTAGERGSDTGGNIGYGACRPATFLSYVRFGSSHNGTNYPALWTKGGMCLAGESAGSAAGAYALAWYGAGSGTGSGQNYLDKYSIISGPVLSDIEQGCEVTYTDPPLVQVCPSGQFACNSTNSPPSWSLYARYVPDDAGLLSAWSGLNSPACAGSQTTTTTENAEWKAMSIVDGNIAAFNYPNTNITAWLCSSVANNGSTNNSSTQGQLFFQNFTSSSQVQGLLINGMSNCGTPEEVGVGTWPSSYTTLNGVTIQHGWQAVEADMIDPMYGATCTSHRGK
jgi:hypothetical protein